jgi:predicted GTPase
VASAADSVFNAFRRALNENKDLSPTEKEQLGREVNKAIAQEPIPTIAIIGEAGVGKSTTLNALFNAGAAVGHSRPTTKAADGFDVEIVDHRGNKGDIRVIDLPGLGESIAKADELAALYTTYLPTVDAILWVHPAPDRMLEFTQRKISEIFSGKLESLADSLVFGLNKADDMYPQNWRHHGNVPSQEQLKNLEDAEKHFSQTVGNVLPRPASVRVTTYSALQYYNLPRLFRMLMDAMPKKRRWVLEQRMDLANFIEKADPRFIAGLQGNNNAQETQSGRIPSRDWIINQMTDEDLRAVARQGLSPEDWWRMKGNR